MNAKISRDKTQTYADVQVGDGVMVELVRGNDHDVWDVWGVRIDGHLYREPRDLSGEPLRGGPFAEALDKAALKACDYSGPFHDYNCEKCQKGAA